MEENNNNKKKRAKKKPDGEHKAPWQETTATVDDIMRFLDDRVMLRHNTVTRRELNELKSAVTMPAVHRSGVEMEAYRRRLAERGSSEMTDDSMTAVF